MSILKIIKRSGEIEDFDKLKIFNAIFSSAIAAGGHNKETAQELTDKVVEIINENFETTPTVEDIQDIIEKTLVENGHAKTAKAYILYRFEHSLKRSKKIDKNTGNIPYKKIYEVLNWNIRHNCDTIEKINDYIRQGRYQQLVDASEKAYADDIEEAYGKIISKHGEIRVVIIAGPSSSGKTTTTLKLEQYLKKDGYNLVALNIDNYYFDLEVHPVDEFGDHDYETPQALDLKLIDEHVATLLAGKTAETPIYNFKTGKREKETIPMKIGEKDIILIDSLHGLFDKMTESTDNSVKFKLYIETLAQIRDSSGNYIRWTDHRLLRRMMRDAEHRNSDPIQTIEHWHYVRRAELRYIMPYLGTVDHRVNSALPYELPIMKGKLFDKFPAFVETLKNNPKKQDAYIRAKRVMELLDSFIAVKNDSCVPSDSLLREFIGGSSIYSGQ